MGRSSGVAAAIAGTAGATLIAETLLAAPAASITFSAIPQTYRHLMLVVQGRSERAVIADNTYVRVNGDTGSNYDWQQLYGQAATPAAAEGLATNTGLLLGGTAAATAAAGLSGMGVGYLLDYASTSWEKVFGAFTGYKKGVASGDLTSGLSTSYWRSTAAVTSLTVRNAIGSNFATGTVASLYGLAGP